MNHGVHGGSNLANLGDPFGVNPDSAMLRSSSATCFIYIAIVQRPLKRETAMSCSGTSRSETLELLGIGKEFSVMPAGITKLMMFSWPVFCCTTGEVIAIFDTGS